MKVFQHLLTVLFLGLLSNMASAQMTVTVQCNTGAFKTGSVNAAGTKNDGNMISISSATNRGWAEFTLPATPAGMVVESVVANFTTYSSAASGATNHLGGFIGDAATMAGTDLYAACGSGFSFAPATWTANALNSKTFNGSGLSFISANAGATVNIFYFRGSTNVYNVSGYPATNGIKPELVITYNTPPANDLCSGAIAINCGDMVSGTTVASTNDLAAICGIPGVTTQTSGGVWYTINVGNDPKTVTLSTCNAPTFDTRLNVYSGECGNLTCIAGNEDIGAACALVSGYPSLVQFTAAPNTTYYILVHGYGTSVGAFTMSVACEAVCTPATTNDVCATAQVMPALSFPGTTTSSNNSCSADESTVAFPSCGSQFASYFDTWYKFNTGSFDAATVVITKGTATDLGFILYSGACNSLAPVTGTCVSNFAGTSSTTVLSGLAPNTDYYVRVFSQTLVGRGTFDIAIEAPNPCLQPTGLLASNITTNSANFGWTEAGTATIWNVEYNAGAFTPGTGAGTALTGVNNTSVALVGLDPSTDYTVYVQADCGSGSESYWSGPFTVSTLGLPPDCNTAAPISCNVTNTLTVPAGNGAWNFTGTFPNNSCGFATPGRETVFQFTATVTGQHIFAAANGTGWVDWMYKEAGPCTNTGWTCLDDIQATQVNVPFNATAGTTYFILADPEAAAGVTQLFVVFCPNFYYYDADGDGYAGADSSIVLYGTATPPANHYPVADDCNDNDNTVNPGATESAMCNGIDENCNGAVDENGIASFVATVTPSCTSATGNKITISDVMQGTTGAPGPYTYSKDGGATYQTSNIFLSLGAGTYAIAVSASNGCTQVQSVVVTGLPVLTTSATPVSCFGGSDGTATVAITGGVAPYSISWKKGTAVVGTTATVANLVAGTYKAYVSDAQCPAKIIASANTIVTAPTAITIATIGAITNVTCFGGNNGAINATISGGTAPYSYLWSNGATTEDISGLTAGTYTLSVTDANGCTKVSSGVLVKQPTSAVSIVLTTVNTTACGSVGSVKATVAGGTKFKLPRLPYDYSWSTGSTSSTITGLGAGTYTIVAIDSFGCQAFASATVTAPAPLAITSITSAPAGTKYTVTLASAGGTPYATATPYKYRRVPTAAFSYTNPMTGVTAGTYTFQVQDSKGCTASMTQTIPVTMAKPIFDREEVVVDNNTLTISPNPTSDVLNIRFGGAAAQGNLYITDAFNRTVLMQKVMAQDGNGMTIQLDRLVAGMYNLTFIATDGTKMAKKFVVVKD